MEYLVKTGRIFYGICMAALGVQQFIYSDFRPVILPPGWPSWFHTPAYAYIIGAASIAASIFIITGKKARTISLFFGGLLLIIFIAVQSPYVLFIQPYLSHHLALWTDPLKELALSGGAFVMAGSFLKEEKKIFLIKALEKFIPFGRVFFSITMISFGIDHFYYTEFVAGLVPSWFPDHTSWTYIAGVALIGSGVAIILKIRLRHIALLLSAMLFLWVILLHIPRAVADPYIQKGNEITSVFEALAFSGIALVIAFMDNKKDDI